MAIEFGKYQLLRRIAIGGMAEVFLAVATGAGGFKKYVAIKRILPNLTVDKEFVSMFLDEARILARFNHPNIVQIFDLGRIKNSYFLAMEFVHGASMDRVMALCIKKGRRFPFDFGAKILSDSCDALDYAHNFTRTDGTPLDLVHRDVSPQNIMISFEGVVKVLDFGIAKAAGNLARTRPSFLKGKAVFMSPEQIVQRDELDRRSDIFSLGTLLFMFATGKRPFGGKTELEVMMSIVRDPAPDPRSLEPEVPDDLAQIIRRALEKDRMARYQTAREMRADLENFLFQRKALVDKHVLASFLQELIPRKTSTQSAQIETSAPKPATPAETPPKPVAPPPAEEALKSAPWNKISGEALDTLDHSMDAGTDEEPQEIPSVEPPKPPPAMHAAVSPPPPAPPAEVPREEKTPAKVAAAAAPQVGQEEKILGGMTAHRRSISVTGIVILLVLLSGGVAALVALLSGGSDAVEETQPPVEPIAEQAAQPDTNPEGVVVQPPSEGLPSDAVASLEPQKEPEKEPPEDQIEEAEEREPEVRKNTRRNEPSRKTRSSWSRRAQEAKADARSSTDPKQPESKPAETSPETEAKEPVKEEKTTNVALAKPTESEPAAKAAAPPPTEPPPEPVKKTESPAPVASAEDSKPTYQAPEVIMKRRISGRDPQYPAIAREARTEAIILVKIYINPDGTVGSYKFLKSHPAFEQEVVSAIKSWRFSPLMINQRPVGTYTVYKFMFKLY